VIVTVPWRSHTTDKGYLMINAGSRASSAQSGDHLN